MCSSPKPEVKCSVHGKCRVFCTKFLCSCGVWNCRERQKGKAGNGCRNTSVAEEELLRGISDALGWEWKGTEVFDTERFLREVQAVHLENGAASVQKWTQRVSA